MALLSAKDEPAHNHYQSAIDSVVKEPRQIRRLIEDNAEEETLVHLTSHSYRLARIFRGLLSFAQRNPKSSTTSSIATETVRLLAQMLPSLHELLAPAQVLEILIPTLDICFVSSSRPMLRDLASQLSACGSLFEHLTADRSGSETMRQWVTSPELFALDARTLESWTDRLVETVQSCIGNHDIGGSIQRWCKLLALKKSLRNLKRGGHPLPMNHRSFPSLDSMTQLSGEDKKVRPTGRQNVNTSFPSLDNNDKVLLEAFDLQVPGSWSTLADVVQCLEHDKTSAILLSIVLNFPCNLCISRLSSSPQTTSEETRDERSQASSNSQIQIVDEGLGVWQIRMSAQALKSIQHLNSHGQLPSYSTLRFN